MATMSLVRWAKGWGWGLARAALANTLRKRHDAWTRKCRKGAAWVWIMRKLGRFPRKKKGTRGGTAAHRRKRVRPAWQTASTVNVLIWTQCSCVLVHWCIVLLAWHNSAQRFQDLCIRWSNGPSILWCLAFTLALARPWVRTMSAGGHCTGFWSVEFRAHRARPRTRSFYNQKTYFRIPIRNGRKSMPWHFFWATAPEIELLYFSILNRGNFIAMWNGNERQPVPWLIHG